MTSAEAAFAEEHGRVCILSYASYKNPGGRFLKGSTAQEEWLCHESTLYPVLRAFDGTYYAWNRGHLNKALYLDRASYSKEIIFFKGNEKREFDVLTCAAPNFYTASRYRYVGRGENRKALWQRIKFMFSVAESEEVDTLIAGAWGCGVFGQDPESVVRILIEEVKDYNIPRLIFAIPRDSNYWAFRKVLEE